MDFPQRFWNIFLCVLDAIGEPVFQRAENGAALVTTFEGILTALGYALPIVDMIMRFIRFAFRVYNMIRAHITGSQPLEY